MAGAGGVVAAAAGQIVGVHSGKCVDVKGANTADGTPIQLYRCNGTAAQQWKLEADGASAWTCSTPRRRTARSSA
ncbi:RICIN domain-containing protein [Streptomyces sp. NPDC050585]|uniref:RICIN domain-containing protein n=1 Tax=Streptomyces sp. NPDC050585 TaxID=3365632 RepID=UPI0037BAB744